MTYDELMLDLAHAEPRHGYTRDTLKLTTAQAAVVLERYPDLLGEALVGAETVIARQMRASEDRKEHHGLLMMGIAAEVVNRIRDRAPGWILSDVLNACAEKSRCAVLEEA